MVNDLTEHAQAAAYTNQWRKNMTKKKIKEDGVEKNNVRMKKPLFYIQVII